MTMTKDTLAQHLADTDCVRTKAAGKQAVDGMIGAITSALCNGEEVRLAGFSNIKVVKRAARTARNPIDGSAVEVPAKVAVKFKVSKPLADAVNTKKLLKKLS